ncbi:hypothetical protein H4W00_002473 [Psychrobacter sp. PL19]
MSGESKSASANGAETGSLKNKRKLNACAMLNDLDKLRLITQPR